MGLLKLIQSEAIHPVEEEKQLYHDMDMLRYVLSKINNIIITLASTKKKYKFDHILTF